jgi:hypothetical protein
MKIKVDVRRFNTENGSFINIKDSFITDVEGDEITEKVVDTAKKEILERISFTIEKVDTKDKGNEMLSCGN